MVKLAQSYGLGSPIQSNYPLPIISSRTPTTGDKNFTLGQLWVYTTTAQIYALASVVAGSATWSILGPGASDVDTITGDSGGALSPTAGNMNILGGTNITVAGAGSTLTANMDAAIVLATSVSSPIYTSTGAIDTNINAVASQDIIMKLGDAGGVNKLSIVDSASAEVFAVDSNGALTFSGLTVAGAFAQTGGTFDVGQDNAANAIAIGGGTTARVIGLGDSAAAHVITIGTVTGAASLDLLCGTGDFTLEGDVASTYDISSTGVNIGTVTIGAGTGARTVNLATGGTGVKTVNIATAAIGNIVTIGSVTAAASLDLRCGTGDFTLEGDVASTYDISSTGVNIGTVTIGAGTGARTVNLGTGGTGIKTVNIGTGAIGNIVTVGTVTAAASLDLLCGTGNFTLEGNIASTYDISGTGANTGDITISGGTGAQTTNIATGGTGVKTLNLGTGAIGNVVTMGTVTGAASLDLLCGTGNFTLEGNVASTYDISGTGANTGIITIGGGTGAQTLNMMNSTAVKTVNIAAGAAANVVTIGSTTGAASLTLQSGTGKITVTGTVKEIGADFLESNGDEISEMSQSAVMTTAADTAGVATGAGGDVNLMSLQQGVLMEQFIIGTQTIIGPRMDANGLLVSLDLTVAEGAEYNFGAGRTNSRHAFTVGTDAAFFFEIGLRINDMDGAAPYIIGFRKSEANNATFGSYTDYAAIGMIAATSAVNIVTVDELNGGGQTITSTTDAWGGDGTTNTLRVLVSAAGVVTYTVNGSAPSAAGAITFDGTDVVCPFIHLIHSASATAVNITSLKCGFTA